MPRIEPQQRLTKLRSGVCRAGEKQRQRLSRSSPCVDSEYNERHLDTDLIDNLRISSIRAQAAEHSDVT